MRNLGKVVETAEGYTLQVGGFTHCVASSVFELAAVSLILNVDVDEFHFREEGTCACCRGSSYQLREVFFACRNRLQVQALLAADPRRDWTESRGQRIGQSQAYAGDRRQWEEEMQYIPDFPDFD